jgi:hypothetical protein
MPHSIGLVSKAVKIATAGCPLSLKVSFIGIGLPRMDVFLAQYD